jgi:hypothetical protein
MKEEDESDWILLFIVVALAAIITFSGFAYILLR